ncbi:LysR substrate-binding domain-containing protein [Actinomadura sp. SCN-SB]|uniref:LysR family transcriptional regulator n=1 Tax=Actinomadura sp. SCN-SB TaxID=3373092 RepID=UPI00375262E8
MFDVHRLRLLRELSRHGTIAETARTCSLTPSAVSQQLSALEREVGTPLFLRDGRRLAFTEAARVLVEHTERILAELEEARAHVAELTSAVGGTLRLGAFPTAARALVPTALARCKEAHPDLRVRLSEHETEGAIKALTSGRLDAALIYEYNLLPKVRETGIETDVLFREPLLALVPADLHTGPVTLSELADQPWIAAHSDDALHSMFERACGLAGFAPRVEYTSNDYTVIFALVRAGLGVALVPRLAVEAAEGGSHLCEIADLQLSRTVAVAVRAGSRRNPPIAVVLRELRHAAHTLSRDLAHPPEPVVSDGG